MSTVSRKNDYDDEQENMMSSAVSNDNQEAQLNWITKSLGVDQSEPGYDEMTSAE